VHAFVFGDGLSSSSRRHYWKMVGRFIVKRQCSLLAEELYPFLWTPPPMGLSASPREAAPILQHFRGTFREDGGSLRCEFHELASPEALSLFSQDPGPGDDSPASLLEEKPRLFSRRPAGELQMAAGLGIANLVGVLWLESQLKDGGLIPQGPVTPFLRALSGFLLAYAVSYLAIPCARWAFIQVHNVGVHRRNTQRRAMASELSSRR
jgi:hypothetical protein